MTKRAKRVRWSYSAGHHGCRVSVFERANGKIYAQTWDSRLSGGRGGMRRVSLGHSNRARARAYADEQAVALQKGQDELLAGTLTIARLFRLYMAHQSPRKGSAQVRKDDARRVEMWKRILGPDRDARRIMPKDWQGFIDARSAGAVDPLGQPVDEKDRRRVGPRTVQTDLKWLRAVLSWATRWSDAEGRYLLRENPVRGYEMPHEKNPERPIATQNQLEAILAVADRVTMEVVPEHPLHPEYGIKTEKPKKLATVRSYLPELLVLTNGTGRRIGSVRSLTFADLRLDEKPWGAIRWAADHDKTGRETTTPIGPDVRAALDEIMDTRPGIGETPLFPAPEDPTRVIDKYFAGKLISRGMRLAREEARREGRSLRFPPRFGYHSFRRKFATELKSAPDRDVADLGGWKDLNTLRQIYQQADHSTMVAALSSRLELREAKG